MIVEQFVVEVSLNGQQFTNHTADGGHRQFVAYEPPRLERTFPDTGPIGTDVVLQLNGTNFMRGSDYVCDFWVAAPVHERNYTAEELEWGHVAPSAEAAGADWPVCCGAARAASCLGADSTCTAATFVSDGEVRGACP